MKPILLLLLFSCSVFSQTIVYEKTKQSGTFSEYQTKSGQILKIGDTITIAYPMSGTEFTFLTQGDLHVASHLSNVKIAISKIKSVGNATRGFKTYLGFKGYGMNCFIDYESALDVGEIKNPFISNK